MEKDKLGFDTLKTKSIKKINKGEEITVLYFEGVVIWLLQYQSIYN